MKIASITLFCNEHFRIDTWIQYYNEYKNDISLHVIVNNGDIEDVKMLKNKFPDSLILHSPTNNMVASYNLALKEILKEEDIDAIMQITNDIRFEKGAIAAMYKKLYEDKTLAVVGPIILKRDSRIIESAGFLINGYWGWQRALYKGCPIDEIEDEFIDVSFVPGGVNMIKRSAYELIGFQDENIHMYCDEMDLYIRFHKKGLKEGILKNAIAWHQHVDRAGSSGRPLLSTYLSCRNKIYIVEKHNGFMIAFIEFCLRILFALVLMMKHLFSRPSALRYDIVVVKGLWAGLTRKMNNDVIL